MSESPPTVSVCIPTFNGARHIGDALQSVANQSMDDLEIIISDDGSDDGTLDVVKNCPDPRLRVLPHGDRVGAAGNWTRVVQAARGANVKLLCQDDVLDRDCLESELRALEDVRSQGYAPAFVSSRRRVIWDDGRVLLRRRGHDGLSGTADREEATRAVVRAGTNVFGEPSFLLFPRDTIVALGPFSAEWSYLIDLEFYFRALEVGPAALSDQIAGSFRVSNDSWSSRLVKAQAEEMRRFVEQIQESSQQPVSGSERLLGEIRLRMLALSRRLLYAWMGRK